MKYSNQQGISSMLLVAIIATVVFLWIGMKQTTLLSLFKNSQLEGRMASLEAAKQKLFEFAILQPEIYMTNSDSKLLPAGDVPAIGYFPCPDLDGDGRLLNFETMCGRQYDSHAANPEQTGFAPDPELSVGDENCDGSKACMGYLPSLFASRFFYFGEAKRFFYVLDERLAFQNPNYNSGSSQYFAPLSSASLIAQAQNQSVPIGLTINGKEQFVAVLIDAGEDGLSPENSDGDRHFEANGQGVDYQNADLVLGVTFKEWQDLMMRRVCVERDRWLGRNGFTNLSEDQSHWANDYDELDNPYGSGLFQLIQNCTIQ